MKFLLIIKLLFIYSLIYSKLLIINHEHVQLKLQFQFHYVNLIRYQEFKLQYLMFINQFNYILIVF